MWPGKKFATLAASFKLAAIATLFGILATAPVGAFETRPNKDLTGGSVMTAKSDEACGHAREHRGPMFSGRRDEVLRRYGLPTGAHPDYEIDHLIPLCLGGSDDPSNLWPQLEIDYLSAASFLCWLTPTRWHPFRQCHRDLAMIVYRRHYPLHNVERLVEFLCVRSEGAVHCRVT